jgi:hypothetical protein
MNAIFDLPRDVLAGRLQVGLGVTVFAATLLLLLGCPGEFNGLGPDPLETGTGNGVDGACASCAEPDSAAPDAALADVNNGDDDGESHDSSGTGSDAFIGADAPPADDGSTPDVATDGPTSSEAGCGPLDSINNCGGCGQTCDTTTGRPSCDGRTCSYTCSPGFTDCNGGTAPDTDGCECATPLCCAGSCATTHDNGVGGIYYDCVSASTYSLPQALEACTSYTGGTVPCTQRVCNSSHAVCGPDLLQQNCACWGYDGTIAGHVYEWSSCDCPLDTDPNWN